RSASSSFFTFARFANALSENSGEVWSIICAAYMLRLLTTTPRRSRSVGEKTSRSGIPDTSHGSLADDELRLLEERCLHPRAWMPGKNCHKPLPKWKVF